MTINISSMRIYSLAIPFRTVFSHASATRACTSSIWVEIESDTGTVGYGESCPRPYVTGEDIASAHAFILRHRSDLVARIHTFDDLRHWIRQQQTTIDANPAAWCAVELAVLDLLGKESRQSIESLLDLPSLQGSFEYSAIIGDGDLKQFEQYLSAYQRAGMSDFKIKLSGDLQRDREKFASLRAIAGPLLRVRVDANNLWRDPAQAVDHLRALNYPLFAIEEPLKAKDYAQLRVIADTLNTPIILDESFLHLGQFESIQSDPQHWMINLRVSKMGGLLRSLEIVEGARNRHLPLIVGAQVGETSLLTRAALTIAHAARDICIAREGAFGTQLLEHDICELPLMFGKHGILDVDARASVHGAGLGLSIAPHTRQFLEVIKS